MNVESLVPFLGTPVTSLDLREAFSALGVDVLTEVTLPEDEFSTYVERPGAGVSFSFTDEAMFLAKDDQPIGVGPLFFTAIFFYAVGVDGYSQYQHPLPGEVHLADGAVTLRRRLGEPEWSRWLDGKVVSDRWVVNGRKLHASYSDDGPVRVLTYFLPNAETSTA